MIPQGQTIRNEPIQEVQQPLKTWKIDFAQGKVVGMTDGLDAIKQAVFCILCTDRFRHLIYSFNFGQELSKAIGMSPIFVESEVNRLLNEALLYDDRITAIQNVKITVDGDKMNVSFRVVTDIGGFEQEVELSV